MENIVYKKKTYKFETELFSNECATSGVFSCEGKLFVVTKFALMSNFKTELKHLKELKRYIQYVPKVLGKDKKQLIVIKEKLCGETVLDLIANGELNDDIYKQIFDFYRFCRTGKYELNYLPENFVLVGKKLYYTSEEMLPQCKEKNFENYGIYYWVYSPDLVAHLKEKGYKVDTSRILDKGNLNKKIVLLSVMNW